MFPVADDFAAIAKRLKEIQAEVAAPAAVPEAGRQSEDERPASSHDGYEDNGAACA